MTTVSYEIRDDVAELAICHPPVNVLTMAVLDDLLGALDQARRDSRARAVILCSALPGRFCAGIDLDIVRQNRPGQVAALARKLYVELCEMQAALGKPSIAAIEGAARGGALSVALTCDMILASTASTFAYPEMDVGASAALHFIYLPRLMGRYRAFDILFTGRVFDAAEARELGLISRTAPAGEVLAQARSVAQVLARKSPELMAIAKDAFARVVLDAGFREGIADAVQTACRVTQTDDSKEAVAAFAEKRSPVWKRSG